MKIVRAILATLAVFVFNMVLGTLSCGWLFTWVYLREPTNVWKPMDGPPGVDFWVGTLVLNLLFVAVYLFLRRGIPGKNAYAKGLAYGLCVWIVGTLPGMLSLYVFMTVAPVVVLYWTILGLIKLPLDGLLAAAICAREERA